MLVKVPSGNTMYFIRLRSNKLSPLNKQLMGHVFLFLGEDSCWELTSSCKIFNSGSGYHIQLLWRHRSRDKKGECKISQQYGTIAEAEDNAFKYRYSLESKILKIN